MIYNSHELCVFVDSSNSIASLIQVLTLLDREDLQ